MQYAQSTGMVKMGPEQEGHMKQQARGMEDGQPQEPNSSLPFCVTECPTLGEVNSKYADVYAALLQHHKNSHDIQ